MAVCVCVCETRRRVSVSVCHTQMAELSVVFFPILHLSVSGDLASNLPLQISTHGFFCLVSAEYLLQLTVFCVRKLKDHDVLIVKDKHLVFFSCIVGI